MANLIIKLAISRPKIRIQVGRRHQELQHVRAEHLGADCTALGRTDSPLTLPLISTRPAPHALHFLTDVTPKYEFWAGNGQFND